MFSLPTLNVNGITVNLIMNDETKSVVQFSGNRISTLSDFIFRLKPVISQVIPILREQQPHHITLHVTPSLSFGNNYSELPHVVSLNNFDIDEILNQLRFHSRNSDGGYFELMITNPRQYVADQFRFLAYQDNSSDSNYDTDESD